MVDGGGTGAVLNPIRTVAETGSTNADLLALAAEGAAEGLWLRAHRQSAGRGRQGRSWASPPGNLYASLLVRIRASDPPPATLALVAAVALHDAVAAFLPVEHASLPASSSSDHGAALQPRNPAGEGMPPHHAPSSGSPGSDRSATDKMHGPTGAFVPSEHMGSPGSLDADRGAALQRKQHDAARVFGPADHASSPGSSGPDLSAALQRKQNDAARVFGPADHASSPGSSGPDRGARLEFKQHDMAGEGAPSDHEPFPETRDSVRSASLELKPYDAAEVFMPSGHAPLPQSPEPHRRAALQIKWPNDLLVLGRKLSGILLERAGDAVVIGIGVNLAHHPDLADRPTTSLAAHGSDVAPDRFLDILADAMARELARWRGEGIGAVRTRWLARAHPVGTALTSRLPEGGAIDGLFDGLDADGALRLRLAGGERRTIHAADVFLI